MRQHIFSNHERARATRADGTRCTRAEILNPRAVYTFNQGYGQIRRLRDATIRELVTQGGCRKYSDE